MVKEDILSKKDVISELNYILDNLENDRSFYEGDIDCEYTPFEESLKNFCDTNINELIAADDCEFAWDCLSRIIDKLSQLDDYIDVDEDLFRACELLTYYIAKVLNHSRDDLKNRIYNRIFNHIREYEYSQYIEGYLKPLMNGDSVHCSDSYYMDYPDLIK